MKIHRFIIAELNSSEKITVRDRDIVHQMATVLKLKPGERVVLCDGKGLEADCVIVAISPDAADLSISERRTSAPAARRAVHLYAAMLKRDNFELLVQKAVEVGVARLTPLVTRRTIKTGLNLTRLRTIIKEATEQCGRSDLMEIGEAEDFAHVLKNPPAHAMMFDMSGTPLDVNIFPQELAIFIGPEGGWEPEELAQTAQLNIPVVSLGATTLRGETAAIVASYLAAQS